MHSIFEGYELIDEWTATTPDAPGHKLWLAQPYSPELFADASLAGIAEAYSGPGAPHHMEVHRTGDGLMVLGLWIEGIPEQTDAARRAVEDGMLEAVLRAAGYLNKTRGIDA